MLETIYVFIQLIRNLLLTIIIETAIALILKVRDKDDIKKIICINCITNPIINYIMLVVVYIFSTGLTEQLFLFVFEMIVVYSEYRYYKKKLKYNKMNLLLLSTILNASSYFIGLAIIRLVSSIIN